MKYAVVCCHMRHDKTELVCLVIGERSVSVCAGSVLTSLQLMLRDLAMTWMNRLSLRHSLVPAKSELISPRRFCAISWKNTTEQTRLCLQGTAQFKSVTFDCGCKPFSSHQGSDLSWPVCRTALIKQLLESCLHQLSAQHQSTPEK